MTNIRIGIGGWTFEPWKTTFYPEKWPAKRELEYAASKLTAIEINGSYYSSFKPETWANWRDTVPDDFVFAAKASRFCTNRKVLAEAGESVQRFVSQGLTELGPKLGPILWQFMATKKFDPDDFGAFLKLLPASHDGVTLRHAVQVRHDSFHVPEFVALCRAAGVAIVYAESPDYPAIADVSGDFVYARLENSVEEEPAGYAPVALDHWAEIAREWVRGGQPGGLPYADANPASKQPRDTFVFFISGAKVRNPHAAMALIERLDA
jgi:uncharacterized protein YecE (DUF72 family)